MKIKGLLTDRQPLIKALERETGETAVYSGAPSFRYRVGNYTVLRDGSLEADEAADAALLDRLAELGLLERLAAPRGRIAFSAENLTGRTMVNLVNTLAARENLINKAIGIPNAFHMSAELVRSLKTENPDSLREFMEVLHRCGGERAVKGIRLSGGRLIFTGFPETVACRMLAERMVHAAVTQRWSKAKAVAAENERYTFRVWLNALGMKGAEYAEARAALLKNLSGDSSFRTEEQRAAFYAGRNRKLQAESEFFLL